MTVQRPLGLPRSPYTTLFRSGGTGSGKTVVLDTLALSLASNDHTVLWYADGQGGASSNFISQIADHKAFCREEWSDMLSALEAIAEARATENRAIGATDPSQRGFHPTPERPGLAVIQIGRASCRERRESD